MSLRREVRIIPHERKVSVEPGETVLAAALRAGLNLPHSCKSGHCGSCRARLIAGTIDSTRRVRPPGLSEAEAAAGYCLLCQTLARSDLALEARIIANALDAEIKTLPCRIHELELVSPDVMRVMLRLPAVEPLRFAPGQYVDVLIGQGQRRSFSIACPPHDSELLELHVRLAPGGRFTQQLFTTLRVGALLRIEGPFGQFAYREGTRPMLLIAGGTGYAPIKAIVRHVLETGIDRPMHLYWGARTSADLYEHAALIAWSARAAQLTYVPVLSAPTRSSAFREGWVHEAALAEHPELADFDVYAAGPPQMIEAIRASSQARGLPAEQLAFDSFDYNTPPPADS